MRFRQTFYGRTGVKDTVAFGYSLSLFLYTTKVSIPFHAVEVSLDFFVLFFVLVAFIANLCKVMQNTYLWLI